MEEATISLGLLVALLVYRKRFDVPGDPAAIGPLLGLGAFAVAVAAIVVGSTCAASTCRTAPPTW